ncbi:hypothetical protein AB6884_14900 [Carnobacterium maltaromaticum]|uniref:hypothetical protein n=1 Tax=Carnobacterium maltaromaticum TaxID=2751 RepID=UPI0039BE1F3C
MNEFIGVVIGILISISVITNLHLSENKARSKDNSKKIISGGMIHGTKSKKAKN